MKGVNISIKVIMLFVLGIIAVLVIVGVLDMSTGNLVEAGNSSRGGFL